jgi:D-glycero-D-manno-heptose 1,7-bisphosphate phosphatase
MAKALFLDRDGTLIIDRVYLADPAGVEVIAGVPAALRQARAAGFQLFLFTNQSGIGRGYHTIEDTQTVNARMETLLGLPSPVFREVCIAPEAPGQPSLYRKPSPRFITETLQRYGLGASESWMVGDSAADIGAGLAAGIRAAAVRTGNVDPAAIPEVASGQVPVFDDLPKFIQWLMAGPRAEAL